MRKLFTALAFILGLTVFAQAQVCPHAAPRNFYYFTEVSPGTQVWNVETGAYVPLADTPYNDWQALGCTAQTTTEAQLFSDIAQVALQNYIGGNGYGYEDLGTGSSPTLTNPLKTFYDYAPGSSGQSVTLPKMNLPTSRPLGVPFYIRNTGATNSFNVRNQAGTLIRQVAPGQVGVFSVSDNFTSNGSFASYVFVNGNFGTLRDVATAFPTSGLQFDIDGTLASNSDSSIPSQKAVKTYADNKIATGSHTALSVVGRSANSSGNAADIACTAAGYGVLRESGSVLGCGAIDLGQAGVTGTLAAGRFPALTGDVTTSAGSLATTIANDAVTNAKLANMANNTVKARSTAGTGDPEDVAVGTGVLTALGVNTGSTGAFGVLTKGAWTPGISFGGASTGITYSAQTGVYTKLDRLTCVGFIIVMTNKGSSTGNAKITGLPVADNDNANGVNFFINNVSASWVVPQAFANGSEIDLRNFTGGSATNATDALFNNNTVLRGSTCYQAAS